MGMSSWFQSLSGFQVRCNPNARWPPRGQIHQVSIPIGFSSSLQPEPGNNNPCKIPPFQSLSGFQVRCNTFVVRAGAGD